MTAILSNKGIRMSVVRIHPSPLIKSKRGVDMNIEISNHAFDRMHERLGLNKKAIIRMVEKAYELGLTHSQASGNLYKYISQQHNLYRHKGSCIKIYGENVFIFNQQVNKIILVTVFQLPNNLKSLALTLQKNAK